MGLGGNARVEKEYSGEEFIKAMKPARPWGKEQSICREPVSRQKVVANRTSRTLIGCLMRQSDCLSGSV